MADRPEKGMSEAHTHRDPGGESADPAADRAGEDLGKSDPLADAVAAIAGELDAAAGDQLDLLPADQEPVGALEEIAKKGHDQRRGRGKPKGSTNKRNTQVFDYLDTMGHRDPATTLSFIQSVDTRDLATYLGCKPKEALAIQRQAAADLMPYKYAKKPVELNVGEGVKGLPVIAIGELNMQVNTVADGPQALGEPIGQTIENVDETEPASVRQEGDQSHD